MRGARETDERTRTQKVRWTVAVEPNALITGLAAMGRIYTSPHAPSVETASVWKLLSTLMRARTSRGSRLCLRLSSRMVFDIFQAQPSLRSALCDLTIE